MSESNDNPLPTSPEELFSVLDGMAISYTVFPHDPIFTVEEGADLKKSIPGMHCRNLFLRDKKKKMFLITAANETAIDLKKLEDILDCHRLSFGSPERLWDHLGVRPGSVCPFAITNDKDNQVTMIIDKTMMGADIVNVHPMENHMTISLTPDDLVKFIESTGHKANITDLAQAAPDTP